MANVTDLILTRGIPASGKTTWARTWVAADRENRVRLNRDDLRMNLFGKYTDLTFRQEQIVTLAQQSAAHALLLGNVSVVVDDTNLRAKTVKAWLEVAEKAGATVGFKDFNVGLETATERDMLRRVRGERGVGGAVIASFFDRYVGGRGKLPPVPRLERPEIVLPRQYVPDPSLPEAWIFDLDGTLARMTGRGPFEWDRVGEDEVVDMVARIAGDLAESSYTLLVLSGRDAVCRRETERWLRGNGIYPEVLLMRPEGDNRPDQVVKEEMFWRDVAPKWNVLGVFDDRDKVVAMWRAMGLQCFQVAPGAF